MQGVDMETGNTSFSIGIPLSFGISGTYNSQNNEDAGSQQIEYYGIWIPV